MNSLVGRKAAKEYQPKLTKLEADLARAQTRLREIEVSRMDEDEIKDRLLKDEGFRQSYQKPQADPALIEMRGQIQAAIARVEESVDLEPNQVEAYRQMLLSGAFDAERDAQGRPIRVLSPNETIAWYSSHLHNEARRFQQARTATPPASQVEAPVAQVEAPQEPPAKPAPKANLRLAQLDADLTPGEPGGGSTTFRLSEIRKMAPPERLRHFPTGAALQEAINKGTVLVDVQ